MKFDKVRLLFLDIFADAFYLSDLRSNIDFFSIVCYTQYNRLTEVIAVVEIYESNSVEDTEKIGATLAERLSAKRAGELYFIMLKGGLGAGKTAFCRGFAKVLSPGSRVKSPSFTIVNEYRGGDVPIFHFDLYRLEEDADLSDIGFYEYTESGHCIIEWSEYLSEEIPQGALTVTIEKCDENSRKVIVEGL